MTPDVKETPKPLVRDDLAYLIPMITFLVFIWIGTRGKETGHGNSWYPWTYVARAIVVGAMLILFRHAYTKIRWNHWWLGLIVGVIGIFQWVGMQILLQDHFEFFRPDAKAFNPDLFFSDPAMRWAFIGVRLLGAVAVVPVMEELFWRDYLWRTVIAPNDFKLARVGEWDAKALVVVSLAFAVVHGNWWLTSIVWAAMVGALLVYTRSLGACIIAHATTNLLLGLYVLHTKQWFFW
jgi:CAAX prenyl protease-like protein